jgi:hypothetical protein
MTAPTWFLLAITCTTTACTGTGCIMPTGAASEGSAMARAATPATAALSTYDLMTYAEPAGWQRSEDEGLVLTKVDATDAFAIIMAVPSSQSFGTVEKDFAAHWASTASSFQIRDAPQRTAAGVAGNGWQATSGVAKGTLNRVDTTVLLVSMTGHGRTAAMTIATSSDAYAPAIDAFLQSVTMRAPGELTPERAPEPVIAGDVPSGGGIAGVWMGVEKTAGKLRNRYATFYADGVYYHDVPRDGFVGFSRATSQRDADLAAYWGSYELAGNDGALHRSGVTRAMPLRVRGADEIDLDGTRYYRCASVDGLRLDGAWTTSDRPDAVARRGRTGAATASRRHVH